MKNKPQPVFGVITDTHLKEDNIDLVKDIYRQFIAYLVNAGITQAVMIGDTFTSRSSQTLACLLAAKEIFDMFAEAHINLTVIPGNHDKVDLNSCKSYLNVYSNPYLTVISDMGILKTGGLTLHLIPYFKEGEQYNQRLKQTNEFAKGFAKSILLTHIAINGVRNNDGSEVEDGVPAKMFNNFKLVLVGHYHDRQTIGDNIHYIGSSHQATFGEDVCKGFGIVYDDCTIEYEQTEFPKYIKTYIEAGDSTAIAELLENIEEEKTDAVFINKHRVIITGEKDAVEAFSTTKLKAAGIDIKKEGVVNKVESLEDLPPVVHNKTSILKGWLKYTEEANLSKDFQKIGVHRLSKIKF